MGFLIRSAFWLSLVLLIIPIGGAADDEAAPQVGPIDAFFAAREAVGDVAGMCERKPDVCEVGRSALNTIGVRAREGARMAIRYIEEDDVAQDGETAIAETDRESVPQIAETMLTGSVEKRDFSTAN